MWLPSFRGKQEMPPTWEILAWKRKNCHPGLIREEGFGTVNTFEKQNPAMPGTCFPAGVSWTLMTTNIPESSSTATPRTLHTSSLEDISVFCLKADKKHKRERHVSVKSAPFASSPAPSVFSYLPARAVLGVGRRRNPAGEFSWLVVILFFQKKEVPVRSKLPKFLADSRSLQEGGVEPRDVRTFVLLDVCVASVLLCYQH